ncbi:MAG TPA: DUF4209 domain-containing protein [Sphingomicrobium sp.]|nr:DUF4209 domain-containing protein [Sphingomicrobium sp.]
MSEAQKEAVSEPWASAADFDAINLSTLLEPVDRADEFALERALLDAMKTAEEAGQDSSARALRLFAIICSFHLRVEDPAQPWGPRWESPEGRSYTASDLRGEPTRVLADYVSKIEHPLLRARVADVVWYNDRSQHEAATIAIESYCDLIVRRLDGSLKARFEDLEDSVMDGVTWLRRAMQLSGLSGRRELSDALKSAASSLYDRALASGHYVNFVNIAQIRIDHDLVDIATVARDAETLAQSRVGGEYPMAVQGAWNLAAGCFARLGDKESERRCRERSVDETLRMREQVDSSSARAFWTRKAIAELRSAGAFAQRIKQLRAELRELQDASLDEFGQFTLPTDLSDQRKAVIELFEGLGLPEVLLQFAIVPRTPTIEQLKSQALENRKTSILGSLMSSSYSDREGKVIAETPAGALDSEPDDEWIKAESLRTLDLFRHQIVGGFIEPARHNVMMRFPLEERHFEPIATMSPFVPQGHEFLFMLGFARFWQGDFASAAHLLLPQLENSLRHVLLNSGRESSKIKPDMLQEDRSLSGLLLNLRPELEEIFGADIINEIDLLFNFRAGPSLRHEVAHGKLTTGACYHRDAIYACWLIYRLMCLPLVRYWPDQVAPAIEHAAF